MCEWLPDTADVNPWTEDTYDMLYLIFCATIRDRNLRFQGDGVWTFPEMEDGKEKVFWHLTTRKQSKQFVPRRKQKFYRDQQQDDDKERLPDPSRCERLPWVHAFIENSCEPELLFWDYEEGDGDIKTYIWFRDEDFVVILKKYDNGSYRLVTSFYVTSEYKRQDFERKYNNRI